MTQTQPDYEQKWQADYAAFVKAARDLRDSVDWYVTEMAFAADERGRFTRVDDLTGALNAGSTELLAGFADDLSTAAQRIACGRGTCGRTHAGCFDRRPWTLQDAAPTAWPADLEEQP